MTDTLPKPTVNGHDKPQVSLLKFAPEQPAAPASGLPAEVEAVDLPTTRWRTG